MDTCRNAGISRLSANKGRVKVSLYQFAGAIFLLLLFVIALWKQSGVMFLISALAMTLFGLLGRLENWASIIFFCIASLSTVIGVIQVARGNY